MNCMAAQTGVQQGDMTNIDYLMNCMAAQTGVQQGDMTNIYYLMNCMAAQTGVQQGDMTNIDFHGFGGKLRYFNYYYDSSNLGALIHLKNINELKKFL